MAKVKVCIQKRDDPKTRVSVTLNADVSEAQFSFRYPTMKMVFDKSQPLSPNFPYVTYAAIQAAVESGTFYARHKVHAKTLAIELVAFDMEGNVENVLPFAVATTVAIYDAVGGIKSYTEEDLEAGWDVVGIERQ